VAVTPDGRRALSGSSDQNLRVWGRRLKGCARNLLGGFIHACSISPEGRTVVAGDQFGRVIFLELLFLELLD
jgi:WD40 repeat protein